MTRKKRTGPKGEIGDVPAPGGPLAIEVGAIVHDLRNVFSAIRGLATVIAEDLRPGNPARDDVDQILQAVDRGVTVSHRLSALRARVSTPLAPPGEVSAPVENDQEQSAPWPLHRSQRAASILVVEDDELLRTMIVRVLRRDGYATLEAGNSAEAEAQALAHGLPVDLLLVDVGLPVVGGPELVERLKQRWPAARVLFMSGFGRTALAERGVRPGPGLLEKPFSPPALLERLEALLALGRS